MTDLMHVGTDVLVQQINDEFEVILQSERPNLPRALQIAEKLFVIRARTERGQWKNRFDSFGFKFGYQTATVYLRIAENWDAIQRLAVAKGIDSIPLTFCRASESNLTIDGARELWANRDGGASKKEKATPPPPLQPDDPEEGTEEENEGNEEDETIGDDDVEPSPSPDVVIARLELEPVKMVEALTSTYVREDLLVIANRLANYLGMTLELSTKPAATHSAEIHRRM
jgi:hypothetical protein